MVKEIGSTYWLLAEDVARLPQKGQKPLDILSKDESYVSTCRSAIGLCLDSAQISHRVALLPSFTCESVLDPFLKRGYKVFPYPIGLDLRINWEQFKKKVDEIRPGVVLTHPYFGFNTTEALRAHMKTMQSQEGIVFIEDMTQSMFSGFKSLPANFHVGSIRKWMPLPDGAFTTATFNGAEEDAGLLHAKLKAFTLKGEYICHGRGDKSEFREAFSIAEGILDSREKTYSMSSVSMALYENTDVEEMREKRRQNYHYLNTNITNNKLLAGQLIPVLQSLGKKVCPFHYPIYVKENRKELQHHLASHDIYATVIWGVPKEFVNTIDDNTKYIYEHILCLHIDQRYSIDDMKRIIDVLKQHYNN